MKKSTGLIFVIVVALAAVAYFYDWRRHPGTDYKDPNAVDLAFTIKPEDQVTSITLIRQGTTMVFELKGNDWLITQPISAKADHAAVGDLAYSLRSVVEDRTLQATPDQLESYGLVPPALDLRFTLQNGGMHRLRMGAGDFSGLEVYSQVDGNNKDVVLITKNISEAANKSLDDFRDHSVLDIAYFEINSFDLHNSSGEVSAQKQGDDWNIVKPLAAPGAADAIPSMLQTVGATKLTRFVDDNAKNPPRVTLAKYGLDNPAMRLDLKLTDGSSSELLIGKKQGAETYAMDASRSMIFQVPDSLVATLDKKATDLQAKVLFTGSEIDVSHVELRTPGVTTQCDKDNTGSLVIAQAPGQTGQAADCPDILSPLQYSQAEKVDDQPSDAIRAKFTKPAVVITLTTQAAPGNPALPAGQTIPGSPAAAAGPKEQQIKIEISAPAGDTVYAKSSVSPVIYEFPKNSFDALTSKPSDTGTAGKGSTTAAK